MHWALSLAAPPPPVASDAGAIFFSDSLLGPQLFWSESSLSHWQSVLGQVTVCDPVSDYVFLAKSTV